uniref:Uncharacterized protein n=1 Tax=Cannabis sativa TaxID=3483 RepID=A0A803NH60_CANSA
MNLDALVFGDDDSEKNNFEDANDDLQETSKDDPQDTSKDDHQGKPTEGDAGEKNTLDESYSVVVMAKNF